MGDLSPQNDHIVHRGTFFKIQVIYGSSRDLGFAVPHGYYAGDLVDPAHELSAEKLSVAIQILGTHEIRLLCLGICYPFLFHTLYSHSLLSV